MWCVSASVRGVARHFTASRLIAFRHCSTAPSTSDSPIASPNEGSAENDVLDMILTRYKTRHGTDFILPDAARARVSALLRRLANDDHEMDPVWLADAFVDAPPKLAQALMHRTAPLADRLQLLTVGFGASVGESLAVVVACLEHPHFFEMPMRRLQDVLETLEQLGMTSNQMRHMLRKCPDLLVRADAVLIWQVANDLTNFFSAAQVTHLLQTAPEQVLFTPFDDLESRYEYLHFNMGAGQKEIFKTAVRPDGGGWLNLSLGELKLRHEFLRRAGAWTLPDPRRPHMPLDNPPLSTALSADNVRLAHAAAVSPLEWRLFVTLYQGTNRFADFDKDKSEKRPPVYAEGGRRKGKGRGRRGAAVDEDGFDVEDDDDDLELD